MRGLSELNDREKKEIALGAALGAGCRTCAENLQGMLVSAGATTRELEAVFAEGLAVRDHATATMRRKVSELLGQEAVAEAVPQRSTPNGLSGLIRVAAAVAANSSPDALDQIELALRSGATDADISMAIQIAQAVRSKAQGFSDGELGQVEGQPEESEAPGACCPLGAP